MDNYSKTGLVFLAGAVVGVVAGLLLAPDKGTETRKKISGKAKDFGNLIKGKANEGLQFSESLRNRVAKEYVD